MIALLLTTMVTTLGSIYIGWKLHEAWAVKDNATFFNSFTYDELLSDTPIADRLARKYNV